MTMTLLGCCTICFCRPISISELDKSILLKIQADTATLGKNSSPIPQPGKPSETEPSLQKFSGPLDFVSSGFVNEHFS